MRSQEDSMKSKHEGELQRMRSSELTKLLVASGLCFVLGLAVAMFLFADGATPAAATK